MQTRPSDVVSTDTIIERIRDTRNEFIDSLLKDPGLGEYMEVNFDTFAISKVKLEFLRRDLKELRTSPMDLVHYASLIRHLKEVNSLDVDGQHSLLKEEVHSVFRKYGIQ